MSDTPQVGDTRPAPESVGLREVREALERERARREALQVKADALWAEIGPLRRQAALWRAGVRYDAGAKLLLQQLPDDVDLNDAEAVRKVCSHRR
jgi:hypothetical protein